MSKLKLFLLTAVTAFTMNAAIAGEVIYKWKDSNGNIKYTQSKPPSGIDYVTIRNRTSTKTDAVKTFEAKSEVVDPVAEEQDKVIAAQNADKNRVDAINAQRAEKNCVISKNNLEALNRSTRIQIEENGERRMLTDEERNNRLKEAKDNIAKFCK
ncbi:DUF4124 domain-containing protein [Kangiella sp. HZ709]|uniref:DUF4124 domain-containing protein n=1 Tax=Kangiella sp. HZ709 TaxID=2666328 RepID=UPI0012B0F1A4|nr:DUF4124 domain-containing protein [Kangiella sp. HZ709]MRX28278.1 DUF4124 domain-containing protein [Kangiella sp. HZ709]